MRRSLHLTSSALLLSATILLAGCSAPAPQPAAESGEAPSSSAPLTDTQTEEIVALFAGVSYDYEPAASAKQLAEWSALVTTGTIKSIQEGRVSGVATDEIVDGRTIVIVIENSKQITGSTNVAKDRLTYVEIPSPGGRPAEDYAKALPVGTPIAAYLLPAPVGTDAADPIQNPKAGRPAGVPLYMPSNPQSLIIELQAGGVSLLLEADAHAGKLADVLPSGKLILGID